MIRVFTIILALTITSCANLVGPDGETIISASSFGRNLGLEETIDATFAEPLRADTIKAQKGWLKPFLLPGMVTLRATRKISSDSNVGTAIDAGSGLIGTLVDGAGKIK